MDIKSKQEPLHAAPSKREASAYLQEIKEELKKVEWTTKAELVLCTKIVIGATFLFGIGIYLVDLLVKGSLETIRNLCFWIFG
jgi:preprotein translocase subunit SecE